MPTQICVLYSCCPLTSKSVRHWQLNPPDLCNWYCLCSLKNHGMFIEWRNTKKKRFSEIWLRFSCLLDEWIAEISEKFKAHDGFLSYLQVSLANSANLTSFFLHCTEVRFVNGLCLASFFSGWFITAIVINQQERKLAKYTSVHCLGLPLKNHLWNQIPCIFLKSPDQVDVKKTLKNVGIVFCFHSSPVYCEEKLLM